MNRREFLAYSALMIASGGAAAKTAPWRRLPYKDNPGLLKIFINRFAHFHEKEFYAHSRHWPLGLFTAWKRSFAEPRDFGQPIGGSWIWPRFQWEHRFDRRRNSSLVHWFDFEKPGELRAIWRRALNVPDGNWCGISFDASSGRYSTFERIEGIEKSGFEPWALRSGSETIYFSQSGDRTESFIGDKLDYRRYFSERTLNLNAGSAEDLVLKKVFSEFMLLPSSYAMRSELKVRSLYYP